MKQCHHCGASLDNDALFCTSCGNKVGASGRSCPSCGAPLDEDSLFCAECGTRIESASSPAQTSPNPYCAQQVVSSPMHAHEQQSSQAAEVDDEPKSKTTLIAIIAALAVLLLGFGAYFYYENVYLPEKIDSEAPRTYTLANMVVLRSSRSSGADFNKIASVPFGTELITYEQDSEWARIKVATPNAEGKKLEGYVASAYIIGKQDFFLLNSIFGNQESRETIGTTKCRMALLNYFKARGYIGNYCCPLNFDSSRTCAHKENLG